MTVLRRGVPQSKVVSPGPEPRSRSDIAGCPVLPGPRPSPFVSSYFDEVVACAAGVRAAQR